MVNNTLSTWWWVRVLPPPGTLIWRLPGFIRPRCTAGATHRFAESYYGFKLHFSKIQRQRRNVINEKEFQVNAEIVQVSGKADRGLVRFRDKLGATPVCARILAMSCRF